LYLITEKDKAETQTNLYATTGLSTYNPAFFGEKDQRNCLSKILLQMECQPPIGVRFVKKRGI